MKNLYNFLREIYYSGVFQIRHLIHNNFIATNDCYGLYG